MSDDTLLFEQLHAAAQAIARAFQQQQKEALTLRQYSVLRAVARMDAGKQIDIVTQTGIDRSTMTELVRRLIASGHLVRRRRRDDARAYVIKLTEAGRRALDTTDGVVRAVDAEMLQRIPSADRAAFQRALLKIAAAANRT